MRENIKRRVNLCIVIAFFTLIISSGMVKASAAGKGSEYTNSQSNSVIMTQNNVGEVVILEKVETTTSSAIAVVTSNLSQEESYKIGAEVELYTVTTGATIVYTLDGSEPSIEKGVVYEKPITMNNDVQIIARAYLNSEYSELSEFNFKVMKVSEINASVEEGSVKYGTEVELTCKTEDAEIYYTIHDFDFEENTTAQAIKYTGPFEVKSKVKITAYAVKSGYKSSENYEFLYDVEEKILIDRTEIQEVNVGEFISLKMKVKNRDIVDKNVSLVVAVYDSDDVMIDYIYTSEKLKPTEKTNMESGLRISEKAKYVRSYVIDSLEGINPISNTVEITVKDVQN